MSELLINTMGMPDKPTTVVIYPDGNVVVFRDDIDSDERLTAMEIGDHGRLIDADEIKIYERLWDNDYADDGYDHVLKIEDIDDAPTVIPASV